MNRDNGMLRPVQYEDWTGRLCIHFTYICIICFPGSHSLVTVKFFEKFLAFSNFMPHRTTIWLMIDAENLGVNPSYHYVELHSFNLQYCSISNLPLPLITLQFGLDVSFRIFHQLQFPEFTQESNVTATAQFSITHKVKSTKLASEMTRWINVVALTRLLFS